MSRPSSVDELVAALNRMNNRQQILALCLFQCQHAPPPHHMEMLLHMIGRDKDWFLDYPEDDYLSETEFMEMRRLLKTASGGADAAH